MSAADERLALAQLAETEEEPAAAVTAALLVHARLHDPSNTAGWLCGCLHIPRMGESFHRHQAEELLALMQRRRWLR